MIEGLIDPDRFRTTLTPSELASEGVWVRGISTTQTPGTKITFNVPDVSGIPAVRIRLIAECDRGDVEAVVSGLGGMLRSAGMSGMAHVSGGR